MTQLPLVLYHASIKHPFAYRAFMSFLEANNLTKDFMRILSGSDVHTCNIRNILQYVCVTPLLLRDLPPLRSLRNIDYVNPAIKENDNYNFWLDKHKKWQKVYDKLERYKTYFRKQETDSTIEVLADWAELIQEHRNH